MKKLILVTACVVLMAMLASCSAVPPYQNATMERVEYANDLSEVTNLLGAAMSHGKQLGPEASREIKAALSGLYDAHRLATYALRMYRAQNGMLGYAELENQLMKMRQAAKVVVETVRKWTGQEINEPDDDVEAMIDLLDDMTEKQKDQLLNRIGD